MIVSTVTPIPRESEQESTTFVKPEPDIHKKETKETMLSKPEPTCETNVLEYQRKSSHEEKSSTSTTKLALLEQAFTRSQFIKCLREKIRLLEKSGSQTQGEEIQIYKMRENQCLNELNDICATLAEKHEFILSQNFLLAEPDEHTYLQDYSMSLEAAHRLSAKILAKEFSKNKEGIDKLVLELTSYEYGLLANLKVLQEQFGVTITTELLEKYPVDPKVFSGSSFSPEPNQQDYSFKKEGPRNKTAPCCSHEKLLTKRWCKSLVAIQKIKTKIDTKISYKDGDADGLKTLKTFLESLISERNLTAQVIVTVYGLRMTPQLFEEYLPAESDFTDEIYTPEPTRRHSNNKTDKKKKKNK